MYFLLAVMLACLAAEAQMTGTVEQPEVLQKAGVKRTRCIFKDSRGFLWIGTETGLYRFDGSNVDLLQHDADSPLALPHSVVVSLAEDKAGHIWAGTLHGVARIDPRTMECTIFSKLRGNLESDVDMKVMVSADGRVWAGGSEGISVLDGARFRMVWGGAAQVEGRANQQYVASMAEWRKDTMAVATLDGLVLYNFRNGGFRRLFTGTTFTQTRVDGRSRLWVGTWARGYFVFDSAGRGYQTRELEKTVADRTLNIVVGFAETAGRYWVATEVGVYQVTDSGQISFQVNTADATGIAADNDQYVWVGGMEVKRFFAGQSDFSGFPVVVKGFLTGIQAVTYDGLPAVAFHTWYVPGGLIVTNPEGTKTYYRRTAAKDAANVAGLATDSRGRIWLSTFAGIEILDRHFRRISDSLFTGPDRLVTVRTDGLMIHRDTAWIAYYRRGLSLYDMQFHRLRSFTKDDGSGLVDDLINRLFDDHEGRVWLGGDYRLYVFDAAAGRFKAYNLNPDGSPFRVNDIAQLPGGDLMLATAAGLFRFNPATGVGSRVRSPLLRDNMIESVAVDAEGDVWFVNREHLIYYQVSTGHFTLFGSEDGIDAHDDLNYLGTLDGEHFYLNGNNHIFTFDRLSRHPGAKPMPIYFHSMQVNDSSLPRSALLSPLKLNHTQDRITVEFGAINYIKPEQNLYSYMLTNVDDKWVYSNRGYASYANLSPGTYVLKLRVQNYAGVWSEMISLPLTIRPPYWATWWFRVLSVMVILTAIFFSIRYVVQRNLRERILRLQQEQAVEKERNRIARDMHDDLGSGLTKIAILSEVTKAQLAMPGAAVTNLNVISNASRELVDSLQDIVWVLNPHNDSLASLCLYIREYASGFFEPAGITCTVDCGPVEHNIPLSEEKRRNIFLTVKESCNNVLKYADCSAVAIRVWIRQENLVIEISDNGKGFDPAEVGLLSNGLRNMRTRMEQIGAGFGVESKRGNGTRIRLEVPV